MNIKQLDTIVNNMVRPNLESFKENALKRSGVWEKYTELTTIYESYKNVYRLSEMNAVSTDYEKRKAKARRN